MTFLGCHSLEVSLSLLRAPFPPPTCSGCWAWGKAWCSEEFTLLAPNHCRKANQSQQSPNIGVLVWATGKGQGREGLLSWVQEETGVFNAPGCFLCPWGRCGQQLRLRSHPQGGGEWRGAQSAGEAGGAPAEAG